MNKCYSVLEILHKDKALRYAVSTAVLSLWKFANLLSSKVSFMNLIRLATLQSDQFCRQMIYGFCAESQYLTT